MARIMKEEAPEWWAKGYFPNFDELCLCCYYYDDDDECNKHNCTDGHDGTEYIFVKYEN